LRARPSTIALDHSPFEFADHGLEVVTATFDLVGALLDGEDTPLLPREATAWVNTMEGRRVRAHRPRGPKAPEVGELFEDRQVEGS
jgi:hypothetical protein